MIYKYFFYFFLIFLFSCDHHNSKIVYKKDIKENKKVIEVKDAKEDKKVIEVKDAKEDKKVIETKKIKDSEKLNTSKKLKVYNNKGFTLIYNENLFKQKIVNKKIDEKSIIIFNKNLNKNAPIKITNLLNGKNLITKIGDELNYPFFYNSVISKRTANELMIDAAEPYIQIETLNSNNVYVANKSKTFDEEKNVANKAPVDTITIQNISTNKISKNKVIKKKNKNFNYIIKFADLYFEDSAIMLKERLINEFNIEKVSIKKLSNKRFRVFKGPYKDLGSLKKAYNDIGNIDFENIEIIKL